MESNYDITAIKLGLEGCLPLLRIEAMRPLADIITSAISRLDEPMQLAIIGKISSSKSTLVNAILGKDELMATGQKEVTYNVGWLKYGDPDSDIIIHFKDGSAPARKSRKEFAKYSVDTSHNEIDRISYIETFDNAEILRDINIIDTPGLDAKRERDSRNTLDFISRVRPDAVVMLFTHAVSESTLDVVRQFNTGTTFNPLNAIGILSKIDILWQETIPRDKSALAIGRKMAANRKRKDAMLAKTLYDIFPISALLFLAATTVDEADIEAVSKASASDPAAFLRSLNSMPKFLAEPSTPLSEERRRQLAAKLGLYGIWLIAQRARGGESLAITDVREMLMRESGAYDFRTTLYNHFGSRAKLIKIESIFQHISQEIKRLRGKLKSSAEINTLAAVEQRISDVFSSLVHEHKEYGMLNRLYSGELCLDDDIASEFRSLCGENGNSAPEKLGLPSGTEVSLLLEQAQTKEKQWRREVALEPDPGEREWMNIILKSYSNLRQKISAMTYHYQQSKSFLFND